MQDARRRVREFRSLEDADMESCHTARRPVGVDPFRSQTGISAEQTQPDGVHMMVAVSVVRDMFKPVARTVELPVRVANRRPSSMMSMPSGRITTGIPRSNAVAAWSGGPPATWLNGSRVSAAWTARCSPTRLHRCQSASPVVGSNAANKTPGERHATTDEVLAREAGRTEDRAPWCRLIWCWGPGDGVGADAANMERTLADRK